ncbi:MAG: (Fe-S)-binding protein [Euryarchaeota archaeon]|nr:(Fe-S)-binding protein [Euryarchaeota archaeon]
MADDSRQVRLFATCLADQFDPEAAMAAADVLEAAGCTVAFDAEQTCCGQPAFNLGHRDEARQVALRHIRLYDGTTGPIIVPSGSCGSMMKVYWPTLFAAGSDERAAAERVAKRVEEWSRFLVRDLGWLPERDAEAPERRVAYHPACHGLRVLGLDGEAERLLAATGHRLVPLPRADNCCGFGGGFSVEMPEMSGKILEDKLDCVEGATASGAGTVAALDIGCLMHMRGGHERRTGTTEGHGGCPAYRHVAVLVRDALRARGERSDVAPGPRESAAGEP